MCDPVREGGKKLCSVTVLGDLMLWATYRVIKLNTTMDGFDREFIVLLGGCSFGL